MKIARLLIPFFLILCIGCAHDNNVRQLTEEEKKVMEDTHARLKENKPHIEGSLDDLQDTTRTALADQHSLQLSIAKAQLLESMKSPWVQPHGDMVATQKEVALYHLFSLAEAEQAALEARISLRQESINEVKKAYAELVTSMGGLIESQKLLLTHLNQPPNARLTAFIGNVLTEAKAFRETLEASENPRLKELAEEVKEAEENVQKSLEHINTAIEFAMKNEG